MPPVPSVGALSAAMNVETAPVYEVYDFSDRMVPLLRRMPHQPSDARLLHLPTTIFRLAEYVPRVVQQNYNVTINQPYDGDTEDSDDDGPPGPPAVPPRNHHHHDGQGPSGAGAPPIQV